jgi:RES domain-containing protein
MLVYRIEREKYLDSTLSGIGASLTNSFRWNSKHTRIVYTAESRALALLEVAVHLDLHEDVPTDRFFVEIEIPDSAIIKVLTIEDLPKDWNKKPPQRSSQLLGDQFCRENKHIAMKVPSSIIKQEHNYLLNPLHPDINVVNIKQIYPFEFDHRLKK